MSQLLRGTSRWILLPLLFLALTAIGVIIPQRAGPVALFAAVAPVAYAALIVLLLPLAVLRRDLVLATAVVLAGLVAVLVYDSPPPDHVAGPADLRIMTWNLHGEDAGEVGLPEAVERWSPDLVVLQEAAISDGLAGELFGLDASVLRYPAAGTPPGMVLIARVEVLDEGALFAPDATWDAVRAIRLRLEADSGPLEVIGVHLAVPFPVDSLPCPYCPDLRDGQVQALAQFARERSQGGEPVVLVGDFNLTEREVAYGDFDGLTDVARGATWRPLAVSWLPPVLRLDRVLIGPGLDVVSSDVDCLLSHSDHCPLVVDLRLLDEGAG